MARLEKETIKLSCILTDPERIKYSQQLAEAIQERGREEDDLKSYKSSAKFRQDSIDGRVNDLTTKISTGKEFRDVECEIVWDFKKREKTWKRKDAKEVVRTARITDEELQEEIRFQDAQKPDKKSKPEAEKK